MRIEQRRIVLHTAPVMLGVVFLSLAILTGSTFAADLRVPNRAPAPGEVGYRPADGSRVALNPPSLIWLHEPNAVTYTVEWSRQQDFSSGIMVTNLPWNTYTHNAPWQPADYWWRYRFQTRDGKVSDWSVARKVTVPPEATAFPMPTRAEQLSKVPAGHPRLFLRPEDLPRLRTLATGANKPQFDAVRAAADKYLAAGPTPEPEHMGSANDKENAELVKYWYSNRTQTEKACIEAETLAFVYLITGDPKYGEGARKWVLHLAGWNPDGPTNFRTNCEAGKPMLFRPARAYDWAWDMFTSEERKKIQAITLRRVTDAWNSGEVGRGTGHLNRPFNSHGNRTWHKIGEAGITFLGEIPEASTWLDYAVNKFYACYPVWADDDGGWHEGVSYWAGYLGKSVWWLQVAQSALGIDGLRKPFFSRVGDYPLYVTPPHSPNSGFGDLSFRPPSGGAGSFMDYFVRMKGAQPDGAQAGYWRWWTEQWRMQKPDGVLGFLYAANLSQPPAAKAPSDLPASKVFNGIGVASLHTTLLDSRDDVHFLFKSSPFGSQSHGHNPQNTFQLNAYGACLLTTCVYRDLHGSKFHYQWAHSTKAHNSVLVNGQGQVMHSAAPQGRIAEQLFRPGCDYIAGDAAEAYGGKLKTFRRHVAFLKGDQPVIVLCDELEAAEPSTFQFMLHAFSEFAVDEAAASAEVEQPEAGLRVFYLGGALKFRQFSGYDPKPSREFPTQWHLEAGTTQPNDKLEMLTVLVPYRKGQRPEQVRCRRLESPTALGAQVEVAGKTRWVGFRKQSSAAQAELDGKSFAGPVLLRGE